MSMPALIKLRKLNRPALKTYFGIASDLGLTTGG